ncbi:MAG: hypothetical protein MH204_10235 [Fimbriimonadaceae bacterium]|nr:hypothetical protein [Fimbriimonadaceae bacterium]
MALLLRPSCEPIHSHRLPEDCLEPRFALYAWFLHDETAELFIESNDAHWFTAHICPTPDYEGRQSRLTAALLETTRQSRLIFVELQERRPAAPTASDEEVA